MNPEPWQHGGTCPCIQGGRWGWKGLEDSWLNPLKALILHTGSVELEDLLCTKLCLGAATIYILHAGRPQRMEPHSCGDSDLAPGAQIWGRWGGGTLTSRQLSVLGEIQQGEALGRYHPIQQ